MRFGRPLLYVLTRQAMSESSSISAAHQSLLAPGHVVSVDIGGVSGRYSGSVIHTSTLPSCHVILTSTVEILIFHAGTTASDWPELVTRRWHLQTTRERTKKSHIAPVPPRASTASLHPSSSAATYRPRSFCMVLKWAIWFSLSLIMSIAIS